jgi:Fe-coproporphyrin III synthase
LGNIKAQNLEEILNGEKAMYFRKNLDMDADETCRKCVCSLYLPPRMNPNPT